jgi:hypothetical protein
MPRYFQGVFAERHGLEDDFFPLQKPLCAELGRIF